MDRRRTLAIAVRVVRQFRRDPRTLALIVIVPAVVLSLVGYLLRSTETTVSLALVREKGQSALLALLERAAAQANWEVRIFESEGEAVEAVENGDFDGAALVGQTEGGQGEVRLVLEGANPQKSMAIRRLVTQAVAFASLLGATQPAPSIEGETPAPAVDVRYVFGGPEFDTVDFQAPPLIGFFAFFFVFLLTAVSFLRERTGGTLERLMVTPTRRGELVVGYMLGFGLLAALQSVIILLVALFVLDIDYRGNLGLVFLLVITLTVAAVNLGIFLSTYARNELQAIQFIPLVIVPQGLLSGVIWEIGGMPNWLQGIAHVLPLTYSNDALRGVMLEGQNLASRGLLMNLAVLLAFALFFVILSALTLRRRLD